MPAKKPLKVTDARRETGPKEIRQPRKPKQVQSVAWGERTTPLFNDRRKS